MSTDVAETWEQQLVTNLTDHMWAVITEKYSPDAVEQIRWAVSQETLRTITASVLNALEQLPDHRIIGPDEVGVPQSLMVALELARGVMSKGSGGPFGALAREYDAWKAGQS